VTYIIDREGRVIHIFNSQTRPEEHVREALRILKSSIPGSRTAATGWKKSLFHVLKLYNLPPLFTTLFSQAAQNEWELRKIAQNA